MPAILPVLGSGDPQAFPGVLDQLSATLKSLNMRDPGIPHTRIDELLKTGRDGGDDTYWYGNDDGEKEQKWGELIQELEASVKEV